MLSAIFCNFMQCVCPLIWVRFSHENHNVFFLEVGRENTDIFAFSDAGSSVMSAVFGIVEWLFAKQFGMPKGGLPSRDALHGV